MARPDKIYSSPRQRFSTAELQRIGFRYEQGSGSMMVKRAAGRVLLATASSLDGKAWRVKPYVRSWR
ncbi:hypothetical protein ACWV27_25650 (plasmid) [Massilia varians]